MASTLLRVEVLSHLRPPVLEVQASHEREAGGVLALLEGREQRVADAALVTRRYERLGQLARYQLVAQPRLGEVPEHHHEAPSAYVKVGTVEPLDLPHHAVATPRRGLFLAQRPVLSPERAPEGARALQLSAHLPNVPPQAPLRRLAPTDEFPLQQTLRALPRSCHLLSSLRGDAILIWSGAASVSYYAIQLAKLAGLKVYTTASEHHHAALTRLGADAVFDYRDPEVVQKIRTASSGAIRVALDGISEFGSTALAAQALSDRGGKIISLLGRPEGEYPANVEIVPTFLYSVLEEKNEVDRADIAEWHTYLPQLLEDGKLRVHNIDHQSGGLEAIPTGLAKLKEGKVSGQKIVYTISK
ncbi:NAD(P)-binding protein [Athelia psychrophila]|uniref:NAD(P)-binding protein n=1 Tax=Athelia psychrophila TaxID=1759441 RepID=A0A166N460_9AGAM|nr:NAD(P)-binding protein [Fibularhizoctonia sp. CBS 109695]